MKILSNKQLIISSEDSINIESFSHISSVVAKSINNNKISLTFDPNNFKVEKILEEIYKSKIQVSDITTQQPDLEEIFKHLIAKK